MFSFFVSWYLRIFILTSVVDPSFAGSMLYSLKHIFVSFSAGQYGEFAGNFMLTGASHLFNGIENQLKHWSVKEFWVS